jgi:hypothetical protein
MSMKNILTKSMFCMLAVVSVFIFSGCTECDDTAEDTGTEVEDTETEDTDPAEDTGEDTGTEDTGEDTGTEDTDVTE